MALISIIIASDSDCRKDALSNWLGRISNTFKVVECVKVEEIIEVAMRVYPDLILLAITETEVPLKLIQSIKEVCPQTILVVVNEYENTDTVLEFIKAGADACLGQVSPRYLSRILELVCRSSIMVMPRHIKNHLMQTEDLFEKEVYVMLDNLTSREKQIFDLLMRNFSNKKIADILFISESTVKTHARNIFRKVGTKNRSTLLHQCYRNLKTEFTHT